jgi:hypothetical protein
MFSADLAMNMQVLCFMNDLGLVEYTTRAFTSKGDELGNLSVVSPCDGFFKLTYNGQVWSFKWLLMFGNLHNDVIFSGLIEREGDSKITLINPDGQRLDASKDNSISLTVKVEGGDDAKNLAVQVMTWVMNKIGKITNN